MECATRGQHLEDWTLRTDPDLRFYWSGCRDLNSGPSVPQIDTPQTADLCKRPETVSGLPFWLIVGSRWYALFRDVSRPVRGLTVVARSVPMRLVAGFVGDEAGGAPAYRIRSVTVGLRMPCRFT